MEKVNFKDLKLSNVTIEAISKKGYIEASEIQAKVIPLIFEQKSDVIGIAQTGTGKTGAFGLPLIDMIDEKNKVPQSIILTPTRELALQVTSELKMFSGKKRLNILTVYGGASISNQIKDLKRGVDIVVGTPGRVVDLIKRGNLLLGECKYFILDEADEMLKMGFVEDIEFILGESSKKRRVYLFSATMPNRIKQLSKNYMKKQIIIEVEKKQEVNDLIKQQFVRAKQSEKFDGLIKIIDSQDFFYGIIFCRTKSDVDNVSNLLKKSGHLADCIHGDIPQARREKILAKFKNQKINILVATDVAARGIDVENLTHVINYSLPEDVETYTHRIGRTGRAGNNGIAISLVTNAEMRRITTIEKVLKVKIEKINLPTQKQLMEKSTDKFLKEINNIVKNVNISDYSNLAETLMEKHDPVKLVNALLHKIYNKNDVFNKSRKNSNIEDESSGNGRGNRKSRTDRDDRSDRDDKNKRFSSNDKERNSQSGNLRIFIAKGKIDRLDKTGLIRFIEKETNVKLSKVADVKICEKFSFLTLKQNEANDVVDSFESQNRRRPLAEIAN